MMHKKRIALIVGVLAGCLLACNTFMRRAVPDAEVELLPPDTEVEFLPTEVAPLETDNAIAAELAVQVDIERVMADVRWLADDARRGRLTGSPEEDEVGAWLEARFQELGLESFDEAGLEDYTLSFTVPEGLGGGEGENMLGVLPGSAPTGLYVLVGAHYDHIGVSEDGEVFNGADDNAVGVAVVLETARLLSSSEERPEETIVFIAFSGEEIGLLGSRALCEQLAAQDLIHDSMLLNLEVMGAKEGTGTVLDVWDQNVATTKPLVTAVEASAVEVGFPTQRMGRDPGSDALQMLRCDVPAISVSVAWSFDNHPHYHQLSDDVQFIDEAGVESAAQVIVGAVWKLADGEP